MKAVKVVKAAKVVKVVKASVVHGEVYRPFEWEERVEHRIATVCELDRNKIAPPVPPHLHHTPPSRHSQYMALCHHRPPRYNSFLRSPLHCPRRILFRFLLLHILLLIVLCIHRLLLLLLLLHTLY